jgi:hypothetical protein
MIQPPEPGQPLTDPILPPGNPSRPDAIPARVVQVELAALEADVANLFNIARQVARTRAQIDRELDARVAGGPCSLANLIQLRAYVMKARLTIHARAALIHPELVDPVGPLGQPPGHTSGWEEPQ